MTIIQAIILGIVQGVTEYIPVSSSAHLALVPWLLGWELDQAAAFPFNVLIQWGTLVGVLIYFERDLRAIVRGVIVGLWQRAPLATLEARLGWYVVLATLPALVLGLPLKEVFETAFGSPRLVGALLIGTAAILATAEYRRRPGRELAALTWLDALIVGLWQVLALLPGVSRSGATMSGGMLRGLQRRPAARLSFLMSIPVLAGAGVVALHDLLASHGLAAQLPALAAGFLAAAMSGYACLRWLLGYLQRGRLYAFALYCAVLGCLCLVVMR
jgi:undecaprenyl-diphosphatase